MMPNCLIQTALIRYQFSLYATLRILLLSFPMGFLFFTILKQLKCVEKYVARKQECWCTLTPLFFQKLWLQRVKCQEVTNEEEGWGDKMRSLKKDHV